MESQPQNHEFSKNPETIHPCFKFLSGEFDFKISTISSLNGQLSLDKLSINQEKL